MTRFCVRNELTEITAFSLLHLLWHLKGTAFKQIDPRCLTLNPTILDCFRDSPLDIRFPVFSRLDMLDEGTTPNLKQMIRPKTLSINIRGFSQPLSVAIMAKQWCSQLDLLAQDPFTVSIDECIKISCLFFSSADFPF